MVERNTTALYPASEEAVNTEASSVAVTPKPLAVPSSRIAWIPAGIESCRNPAVFENTSTLYAGSTWVGILFRLNESTSNREPEPPWNTRNNGPEPLATDVVTFWKTSQSPVEGTETVPSSVPVAEPERISIVPPG